MEKTDGAMEIMSVERGSDVFIIPKPDLILKNGDHLVIQDTPKRLKEFEKVLKGTLDPAGAPLHRAGRHLEMVHRRYAIATVAELDGRQAGRRHVIPVP